jgi:ABC-type glycerol-3-phosphate transport system permease component
VPRRPSRVPWRTIGWLTRGSALLLVMLWALLAILPVVIALLSSFKSDTQLVVDPTGWPSPWQWSNYGRAWNGPSFGEPFWLLAQNSVMATAIGISLGLGAGTCAAYALARASGRLFGIANRYFVLLITVPAVVTWVPLFSVVQHLGMLSSPPALGLIYAALTVPMAAVLMKAYFASFPLDLIEAAKIDGASEWRAFLTVVLPMSRGTLMAVGLVQGISLWNELALAAVLLVAPSSRTLTIGLALFQGQQVVDRAGQFATLMLMIAPIVILYFVFERRITEGIRLGALK